MPTGQILSGNFINAIDLQDEFAARTLVKARATSPTTWISDTAFKNVAGLACAMSASQVYKLRGRLKITGANTTHDVKLQFTLPSGATIEWSVYAITASQTANPVSVDMSSNSGAIIRGTIAGTMTYEVEGFITVSTTAGNAQLQAAQNVSDPGTLSLDAGSEISVEPWV